jgi:hypothetical protein
MEEKSGKWGRMEATFEGGQGPEGAVVRWMDGCSLKTSLFPNLKLQLDGKKAATLLTEVKGKGKSFPAPGLSKLLGIR